MIFVSGCQHEPEKVDQNSPDEQVEIPEVIDEDGEIVESVLEGYEVPDRIYPILRQHDLSIYNSVAVSDDSLHGLWVASGESRGENGSVTFHKYVFKIDDRSSYYRAECSVGFPLGHGAVPDDVIQAGYFVFTPVSNSEMFATSSDGYGATLSPSYWNLRAVKVSDSIDVKLANERVYSTKLELNKHWDFGDCYNQRWIKYENSHGLVTHSFSLQIGVENQSGSVVGYEKRDFWFSYLGANSNIQKSAVIDNTHVQDEQATLFWSSPYNSALIEIIPFNFTNSRIDLYTSLLDNDLGHYESLIILSPY